MHDGVSFGDATVTESFLILKMTPINPFDLLVVSVPWSVVGSLSGLSRCVLYLSRKYFVPQQCVLMQWYPYGSQRTTCVDQSSSPTTGHPSGLVASTHHLSHLTGMPFSNLERSYEL